MNWLINSDNHLLSQRINALAEVSGNISERQRKINRNNTIWAIVKDFWWPFPPPVILEIIEGHTPQTIGPQRVVRQTAKEYDAMVMSIGKWKQAYIERAMFHIILQIIPGRYGYGFDREDEIMKLCQWCSRDNSPDTNIAISVYYKLRRYNQLDQELEYAANVSAIILLLTACFILAPEILPYGDFSPVVAAARNYGNYNYGRYTGEIIKALNLVVENTEKSMQQQQSQPDVPLVLEATMNLLADGKARSQKEIMEELGISQRLTISQSLQFALNEFLVVTTEKRRNSPKQKYRLSEAGHQYLQQFRN